ncbi:MAG: alpha/beta hydrolase family protein [Steroidobacteraceae bacterium]
MLPRSAVCQPTEFASVRLVAADGYRLQARLYESATAARGVVLIVPAMAVRQDFYAEFAAWLAARRWDALTFDFRGIGESAPRSLRGFETDILTWARQDCAAALAFARDRAQSQPVIWIGHSLGGQVLAMTPGNDEIAAAVTVACGVGYWRENAYPLRRYSWLLWHVIVPFATALCGYFPGRRLGILGDLPKGVVEQWSRWCRNPEYAVGVEGSAMRQLYARVTLPLLGISFTDDEYMSERNIAVLHGFYANAPRELRRLTPAEVGATRIGHFGFFRADVGRQLWPMALAWADAATSRSPRTRVSRQRGDSPTSIL